MTRACRCDFAGWLCLRNCDGGCGIVGRRSRGGDSAFCGRCRSRYALEFECSSLQDLRALALGTQLASQPERARGTGRQGDRQHRGQSAHGVRLQAE